MVGKYWEHFPNESGVGVRGVGGTVEEAFEQAAVALAHAITDPKEVATLEEVDIECEADDDGTLLAEWLTALIREMAAKQMLFSRFDVKISGNRLRATVWGEGADKSRHKPAAGVKGVMRKGLLARRDQTGTWLAQCVVVV
jgi:tRNA nucleotidyltransferase (CCA-adding enzyme)